MNKRAISWIGASLTAFACASPSLAIDEAHYRQARQMIEKSIEIYYDVSTILHAPGDPRGPLSAVALP